MMARIAATRSIIVFVVSSLFVLSLARRTIDQLPGDAEGSASSLRALASPTLLLLLPPRGESDPSVADQDPDKRADLEAAKPLPAAAAEDDDPTALAVADRRPGNEEIDAPHPGGGGESAALPAAEGEEEEAERAVAGAEANRRSAEVMGWIPKEGEKAKKKKKKKRGKKPRDSDSDSDSGSGSDPDSDSDDEEEEEDEVEGKRKRKKKEKEKKKEKGGFLKWFRRLLNRFF